ncbi:SAVED domain-containing protein [Pseudactinotalea terrae]|uniref:SAVED domain-containing protein n=1 Tax=Pseudactinotalea terrae TaxID=1743262 RepID=UPI0019D55E36|nr:SAVED domain-containing protein [Pseudactinotalea terrae]
MSRRKDPPRSVVVSVWAKAAGRCSMCGEAQLVSAIRDVTVTIGEIAHQAGATEGGRSPRGDADVSLTARDKEENLMLLCHGCHRKIDSASGQEVYTVEVLRGIKEQHETMVAALTDFRTESRTLVIATRSMVKQQAVAATPREIAFALVESRRSPYTLGNLNYNVTINLTDPVSDEWVWQRGMKQIDAAIEGIEATVSAGHVDHLSVFALAPIPLLAYLGHKLGDKTTVDVFRRSRDHTERAWCWGEETTGVPVFVHDLPDVGPESESIVVAMDVTASVKTDRLPAELTDLPTVRLHPSSVAPGPDLLGSRRALDSFGRAWRRLLAQLENDFPGVNRLHVVAAVPAPAAVAIGRFHRPYADPAMVMYELGEDTRYQRALEIPA